MSVLALNNADGSLRGFMDVSSDESTDVFAVCRLFDDFTGPRHHAVPAAGSPAAGYDWVAKIVDSVGSPTVAVVSNAAGGVMACALDNTSEKQDAAIYAGDVLNWDVTKGLIFEARVAVHVVPTSDAVAVWGVSSVWIDGPDNQAGYLQFQVGAGGVVNIRSEDGTNTVSTATTTTLAADIYHVFRIDASDPADVVYYIDGDVVGTSSFVATGSDAILQPYMSVYKDTGTGVATLYIDRVMLAMNRS